MEIIDISWPLHPQMTEYKDKKTISFEHIKLFERDDVRESVIHLGSHTGTHVDAPGHFMEHEITIDQVSLSTMVGPCVVLDMTHVDEYIGSDDLTPYALHEGSIVLFKTTNSALELRQPFDPKFVYLAASGAEYLIEKKVKAVGIDYLGIERNQQGHETHMLLFKSSITIIEGLRLGHVQAGHYFFVCLPLAVQGLEAAPARAILMQK